MSVRDLDFVLVMLVNRGFGGQEFIPHSLEQLRRCASCCPAAIESQIGGLAAGRRC